MASDKTDYFFIRKPEPKRTPAHPDSFSSRLVHPHPLIYGEVGLNSCDVCRDDLLFESYRCAECDFDMCLACYDKHH